MLYSLYAHTRCSKICVKWPLSKRPKIGFQDQLSLNAGQKYCRMLQGEHSAILSTFVKLQFVIKIFVLSIFEWPFYTGFTVYSFNAHASLSNESSFLKNRLVASRYTGLPPVVYNLRTISYEYAQPSFCGPAQQW